MPITTFLINCPTIADADAIAEALLADKLVACANRLAPIHSAYVWDGAIQREEEHPLQLKTRTDLAQTVEDAVRALHPYEVPPITRARISANADYEAWVHEVTRAP